MKNDSMEARPTGGSSVPAFVAKLWHMVSDKSCDDLISWTPSGQSFVIKDQAKFCLLLLPKYYKHNNMSSFIRQLNKYGFYKVFSVESASLATERDVCEFAHEFFRKGCPNKLDNIKRKLTSSRELASFKGEPEFMPKLLQQVQELQERQTAFEAKIEAMKRENDALWREHSFLRQKHMKQRKIVNSLIQFLITLIQQTRNVNVTRRNVHSVKDRSDQVPLMAIQSREHAGSPVICELDPTDHINSSSSEPSPMISYIISSPSDNRLTLDPLIGSDPQFSELDPSLGETPSIIELLQDPLSDQLSSDVDPLSLNADVLEAADADVLVAAPPQEVSPSIVPLIKANAEPRKKKKTTSNKRKATKGPTAVQTAQTTEPPTTPVKIEEFETEALDPLLNLPSTSTELFENGNSGLNNSSEDDKSLVISDSAAKDFDNHLEVIQSDIDTLKDILQGLDASGFFGAFNPDDPLGLKMPSDSDQNQQLISMNPSLLDVLGEDSNDEMVSTPFIFDPDTDYSELHTPRPPEEYAPSPKRVKK